MLQGVIFGVIMMIVIVIIGLSMNVGRMHHHFEGRRKFFSRFCRNLRWNIRMGDFVYRVQILYEGLHSEHEAQHATTDVERALGSYE